jgi:hypothetical protein
VDGLLAGSKGFKDSVWVTGVLDGLIAGQKGVLKTL